MYSSPLAFDYDHLIMTLAVAGKEVSRMFASIAPRYDLANTVLSFGVHHWWRKCLVNLVPANKDYVALDLCCGTGDLVPLLRRRFGEVVGVDFCFPMLSIARRKHKADKYPVLASADALALPFLNASIDVVTVAFGVRNFERLQSGLSEIQRVLKPGGSLLILEFGQPPGALWGGLYRFYSRFILPKVGALCTGNAEAYKYLPRTAAEFPCGNEFCSMLSECNFLVKEYYPLSGGIAFAYHGVRH